MIRRACWSAAVAGGALAALTCAGCSQGAEGPSESPGLDAAAVTAEVEDAVWAFHAADTARDAEGVIELLWSDYSMLADGARLEYADVVTGSREFMASLELFHTEWSDLRVVPLGPDAAVASFQFRDSIVTLSGELIQSKGPTTFVWERRDGEWRLRYADADHYPIDP